jgi:hypothetical protein
MNIKQLWWIIPLCFAVGWTIGFYLGIPSHITLDYGENVMTMMNYTSQIMDDYNNACSNITCNYYNMPPTENEELACLFGADYVWEKVFGNSPVVQLPDGTEFYVKDSIEYCKNEIAFDR